MARPVRTSNLLKETAVDHENLDRMADQERLAVNRAATQPPVQENESVIEKAEEKEPSVQEKLDAILPDDFFGEFEDLFNSEDVHIKEQIKQDMSPDILLKAPATVTDDGAAQAVSEAAEEKADEEEIEKLKEIIIGIRNLRASSNVHPSKKTELIFVTTKYKYLINQSEGFLKKLGYSENIKVQENKEGIAQNALSIITDGIELYIPFEELVDIEEERKRMEEEKKKVIAEIERASKMLSNPGFVNKAPEAKINEEKAKLEKYQNMLKNLEERLK